jgi:hypothetical protein
MTISRQAQAVANALLALAGNSQITHMTEKPWHSATFAGVRLAITMLLKGEDSKKHAKALKRMLPDYEFTLPRYFVADALAKSIAASGDDTMLEIEILMLEE